MSEKNTQNRLHILDISDKDEIRSEEQRHEALLRRRLSALGISIDFEKITPHGLRVAPAGRKQVCGCRH